MTQCIYGKIYIVYLHYGMVNAIIYSIGWKAWFSSGRKIYTI